jgi:hypothetical protein
MKPVIFAFFATLALSGQWEVVDTLPQCYTGLPFNLEIGNGKDKGYKYSSADLPSWATIDSVKGSISGSNRQPGAWPVNVRVADSTGKATSKQYILNVVDVTETQNVWASDKSTSYYDRKVEKPLRVLPSRNDVTVIGRGDSFRYSFGIENAVGSPVFAFLNLPDGLKGDSKTGTISGAFTVPGIYTLGVESADQSGNTAEGFVTIAVGDSSAGSSVAKQVSTLNKVTVNNNVPFVYDVAAVHAQQTEADKELFDALASVNAAKAELANRQSIYDSIDIKLTAAEANADKAAAAAAKANTDRENAANRLTQTNKALNDAEDKLNLALLYQAGAQDNVKKAEKNLSSAQSRFNTAQAALAAAEKALQDAQAVLNSKKLAETQANTNLQNAQKDYNRANEDFNDAKNKLNAAQEAQAHAQDELTKAQNDLSLAQQAYDQANHQLKEATIQLASAEAARQAALKVLQDASAANQRATSNLGAAEWNLHQAVAALNVANAAKDAADRTSALVIANGSPQNTIRVDSKSIFGNCASQDLPRYSGSVKVSEVYSDRAVLVTGNTILFGACTRGREIILKGTTVNIEGAINPKSKCIEAYTVTAARIA